jgi:hypothetical protein
MQALTKTKQILQALLYGFFLEKLKEKEFRFLGCQQCPGSAKGHMLMHSFLNCKLPGKFRDKQLYRRLARLQPASPTYPLSEFIHIQAILFINCPRIDLLCNFNSSSV